MLINLKLNLINRILSLICCVTTVFCVGCNISSDNQINDETGNIKVRVATFNVAMASSNYGDILKDLKNNDKRIRCLAQIIQEVNPDILFVQELEFDSLNVRIKNFKQNFLEKGQNGKNTVNYPYYYHFPSNAGKQSGYDLDKDGIIGGPYDAHGWGQFPNQFGLAIFSKYPIDYQKMRTFRNLKWKDLPNPHRPIDISLNEFFWSDKVWNSLYLSSKNHIDIPVIIKTDTIHILGLHPQNSLGDGLELRNSLKNFDEIGFFVHYLNGKPFLDDQNRTLKFNNNNFFVIMGDFNSNHVWDGSLSSLSSSQLLYHPLVNQEASVGKFVPKSNYNEVLSSDKYFQTENSNYATRIKNNGKMERIDFVLPSANLKVTNSGVFWPTREEDTLDIFSETDLCSDHRLVFVDILL